MSLSPHDQTADHEAPVDKSMIRRATITGMLGTVVEWFDFMVFALMASTVFAQIFFANLSPVAGTVASLGTFAAGFLARPIGGILFGHLGDRYGRRQMLVLSMMLMGVATVLIGFLPTYASIGVVAPMLLILLRILQGLALGGEFSGATTLILEHAPKGKRAFYASFVAYASGIGFLLGLFFTLGLRSVLTPAQFLEWGWRVPFLASVVLIALGVFLRRKVEETETFKAVAAQEQTSIPIIKTLREQWRTVVRIFFMHAGTSAVSQVVATFMLSYAVLRLDLTPNFMMMAIAAAYVAVLSIGWTFGILADRYGRKNIFVAGCLTLIVGAFPMFWLVDTASGVLVSAGLFMGLLSQYLCNQVESSWLAELFPPEVRCTGVNLAYQASTAVVAGTAPMVAVALLEWGGGSWAVATYLVVLGVISLGCALTARETRDSYDDGTGNGVTIPASDSASAKLGSHATTV